MLQFNALTYHRKVKKNHQYKWISRAILELALECALWHYKWRREKENLNIGSLQSNLHLCMGTHLNVEILHVSS